MARRWLAAHVHRVAFAARSLREVGTRTVVEFFQCANGVDISQAEENQCTISCGWKTAVLEWPEIADAMGLQESLRQYTSRIYLRGRVRYAAQCIGEEAKRNQISTRVWRLRSRRHARHGQLTAPRSQNQLDGACRSDAQPILDSGGRGGQQSELQSIIDLAVIQKEQIAMESPGKSGQLRGP